MSSDFDQIAAAFQNGGIDGALNCLSDRLRSQKKYHELFEALKMQVRQRLGLPLLYGDSSDNLSEPQRNQLEDGLISACREVGTLLLKQGKVREGWMYLRPVGDKTAAAKLLADIEADEENMEELIDVCLRDGVDVQRGFQLILENYGTCNAITTFEGEVSRMGRREQQIAAALLVRHLYDELQANLRSDIGRQEGTQPSEKSLKELVADRPWLFQELTYHVDTTHLAAVIRAAKLLDEPELLRLALDMTEYGRRLHSQFQYPGDEPFTDMYPSHALYLQALLGENLDAALAFFRERATACDVRTQGTAPVETYIDLLAKLRRYDEAIDASIQLIPEGAQTQGLAPSLLELSQLAGQYEKLRGFCQQRGDLLGFTAAVVKASK